MLLQTMVDQLATELPALIAVACFRSHMFCFWLTSGNVMVVLLTNLRLDATTAPHNYSQANKRGVRY